MSTRRPSATRTARRGLTRLAATSAAAATGAAMLVIAPAPLAVAGPAASPAAFSRTATGNFSGTVPNGVCAVEVEALGGAGGSSIGTQNSNGSGARISVTYPVVPGTSFSGVVGGGGREGGNANGSMGLGGAPGGGRGGVSAGFSNIYHHGAGGGGYTSVVIDGTEAVVAGAGGGSGGGHTPSGTTYGFGGNGGLPTAAGVTTGQNGYAGFDGTAAQGGGGTINGGQGGQADSGGAGGTHTTSPAQNGSAADGRSGGNGGNDPGADSGAGGGGGYFAGGGGASTVLSNSQGGSSGVSGAGGGGGASYIAPTLGGEAATDIASSAGPKRNGSGVGADGSVSLTWILCEYDLGVAKSADGPTQDTGLTTWTVSVTNNGPDDMAIGDTVTLTDTLPGTATAITSLVAPAGVTCRADGTPLAVGDPMASPVECARADGSGLDDGESITFTYTQTLTAVGNYVNTASVTDRSTVTNNNTSTDNARVTGPTTDDGTSEGRRGKPQQWSPTPERGTFPVDCEETLTLLDAEGDPVPELVIAGVGTYSVDECAIVFTPVLSFQGTAESPVRYRVTDSQGNPATGNYTPTVLPADPPSTNAGVTSGPQGVEQSWEPTPQAGEDFAIDWSTLTLLDADGDPVAEVVVEGQGTYSVQGRELVFTPLPSFVGTADPVDYRVSDAGGQHARNTYTPTLTEVVPTANDDSSTGRPNQPQSTDPLVNDVPGDARVPLDEDSLTLLDGEGDPATEVTVPEGVYTIADGRIVFTPNTNFHGSVTPVDYRVADENGTTATATYTPDVPADAPSTNAGVTSGPQGVEQSWEPTPQAGEDFAIDWSTLTLLDADGDPVAQVVVEGQGTYSVQGRELVFTPLPSFVGTADPVDYRVSDAGGQHARNTYTPTLTRVVPTAGDDVSSGWWNVPQSVDPLVNDAPGDPAVPLDLSSLTLLDAAGEPATEVTVPEGVYTIADGRIVFTPKRGFTGDPTPVDYRIADVNGTPAEAVYQPTVRGPETSQDLVDTKMCGTPVVFDTVEDVPGLDPSTVRLVDAAGNAVLELTVEGEGTWKVDPSTGTITFTPDGCFVGDTTRVKWEGTMTDGTPVTGTLGVNYVAPPVEDEPVDEPDRDPKPESESDSELADTGGPTLGWLMAGLALAGAGGVLIRRRRGAGGS